MMTFNPLDHRACLTAPQPPSSESAWQEHIPFALLLTELLHPRVFVELGVHAGGSYLAFCEAVAMLGFPCACYGIDTFCGDEHAGAYGGAVLTKLQARHDPLYSGFSRLIPSTFDEAISYFADGTVDLLHIDGLHSYEAAAHDFNTWSPKLSPQAVVLFHDINVRERGFGVWRLWAELSARYPHFAFTHGHGLGVLAVGKEVPSPLAPILALDSEASKRVGDLFFLLGNRITLQVEVARLKDERDSLMQRLQQTQAQLAGESAKVAAREQAVVALQGEIAERIKLQERIHDSVSFRIGMGATAPVRWVVDRLSKAG